MNKVLALGSHPFGGAEGKGGGGTGVPEGPCNEGRGAACDGGGEAGGEVGPRGGGGRGEADEG